MKLFSYLYNLSLVWSKKKYAPLYLALMSFIEASFFPIPPDVMLISMGLAKPKSCWNNALIATMASVVGGVFGYLIGMYAMGYLQPWIDASSLAPLFVRVTTWFKHSGVWVVILAGFTPFPYKIFTISAGASHLSFAPFLLGSILGRGIRFYMVSGLLYFMGERLESRLRHYIDYIGWGSLGIATLGYAGYKLMA